MSRPAAILRPGGSIGIGILLTTAAALADVRGRVTTADGIPIASAEVAVKDGAARVLTGDDGRFVLAGATPPLTLVVRHRRFETATAAAATESLPDIALVAQLAAQARVEVTAARAGDRLLPSSAAASTLSPEDLSAPPSSVVDLLVSAPSVMENGQGGRFQVVSIRGVSGLRTMTLLGGARIVTERRAGPSGSFLDPALLEAVDVVRGPASTHHGSGALGGVVQSFPVALADPRVTAGWSSQGDEHHQALGWGDGTWSFAAAHRAAGDAQAADGTRIYSGFTQDGASVRFRTARGERSYQVDVLPALGRDLHKANTDFPDRTTIYPEEKHLVVRFLTESDDGLRIEAWTHPNDLHTRVHDASGRADVFNEAVDLGAGLRQQLLDDGRTSLALGLDWFGRRGVDAREERRDSLGEVSERLHTLNGGKEDELSVYLSARRMLGEASLLGGFRLTYQRQSNAGLDPRSEVAPVGFVGLVLPLGSGLEVVANAGTGLRFPSLTERFFTGTSGRGGVIGNPDLDPERSFDVDLGLRWYGERVFLSGAVFHNHIDNYIDQVDLTDDVSTFENLVAGRILGFEHEGSFAPSEAVRLGWRLHAMDGEDDDGATLADIPQHRLAFDLGWRRGVFSVAGSLELRFEKDEVSSGETALEASQLLAASAEYRWRGARVRFAATNLLDELYRRAADRKAPLAPGRGMSVTVGWSGE